MAAPRAREGKDGRTDEGKRQTEPIRTLTVRIQPDQDCDGGAKGGDLSQRKVYENDAALDYVNAQVSMNSSQDQAGQKWRQQKGKNFHAVPYLVASKALISNTIS